MLGGQVQVPIKITPQVTVSPYVKVNYNSMTAVLSRQGKDTPPTSLQTGSSYDFTGGMILTYNFQ